MSDHARRPHGVLMAGGMSVRMGRDKASIVIDGNPLWRRQLDLLESTCEPVAATAKARPDWLPAGQVFVPDCHDARGPMAGLIAALEWAGAGGGSHVLVVAVDMPRMTSGVLGKLAGSCHPGQGRIPVNGTFFEPLCAVYPVGALAFFRESARQKQWKLQGAIDELLANGLLVPHNLSSEESGMYFNLNSPDDLAALNLP